MSYFTGLGLGILLGVLWSFTSIDANVLVRMNTSCTANGGFDKSTIDVARVRVYCKDGAQFKLKD